MATQLSREEVEHVARLARLALSDDEIERMRSELAAILTSVASFGELDLAAIPPSALVVPIANAMRPDTVRPSLDRPDALAAAPAVEDGYFRVPAVFDDAP